MRDAWVVVCKPNDEIVYQVLSLAAPPKKRKRLVRLLKGSLFVFDLVQRLKVFWSLF